MKRNAAVSLLAALTLVTVAVGGPFVSSNAQAQPAKVTPGRSDDLRAAYANAADAADGKRLAEASCASCHGANGISATPGIPHLAGQRAAYLHLELRACQAGNRGDNAMAGAVKFLSEDAFVKVAAYYASLDPPQPSSASGAKAAPARPDPVQAGKASASGCGGCHGEGGVSKTPGMPSLVGLDPSYLVASMKAYKAGNARTR